MRKLASRVERKRLLSAVIALIFCSSAMLVMPIPSFSDMSGEAAHEGQTSTQQTGVDGTVYIRADGSIDPQTTSILRNGNNYTITGNIFGPIVVERNNTIVDGAGYTVQGLGDPYADMDIGVLLDGRENVVIRNMEIRAFWCGISLDESRYIRIVGNTITNGSEDTRGISLTSTGWHGWVSHVAILRNNITEQGIGIGIQDSVNNSIFENNLTDNGYGLDLVESHDNLVVGNNIMRNTVPMTGDPWWTGGYGIKLYDSTDNTFYHNNFVDNDADVSGYSGYGNVWNASYPSGGNYWSCYTGVDGNGDGIGDTPFWGTGGDCYPLMSPWSQSGIRDLYASLQLGVIETLGRSSWLNATVINQGTVDETSVGFSLFVDGVLVDSTTVPLLKVGESHALNCLWTPTVKGKHNVTVHVQPVSGEIDLENNEELNVVTIYEVGVDAGDWIKYAYSYSVTPETVHTEWVKVEILTVVATTVTIRGTLHLSNGLELSETFAVNIIRGWMHTPILDTLSGLVIPANMTVQTKDNIQRVEIGYKWTVLSDDPFEYAAVVEPCGRIRDAGSTSEVSTDRETERTYAGMSRTVVHASFSYVSSNGPVDCWWDKQTGVLAEMGITGNWTAVVVETNMFHPISPSNPDGGGLDPAILYSLAIVAIAIVIATVFLVIRRKKGPPEVESPESFEGERE